MMDDRTGGKAAKVCGAFVYTLLLALLLSVQFDFYYDLNDDTMIKDIVSGAYTGRPSGHCIQMLYPLAWCIALFYRAIPSVPWYGLFLCLCQFGVVFLIAARLLSVMPGAKARCMALMAEAVLVLGVFLRVSVVIQYSVTSGICMTGAVFLFLTAPEADRASVFFRRNLTPMVLVILAFLIRKEVCIMLLPFLLFAGLAKWCGEAKFFTVVNFRKYVTLIVTALLCMAAVYSLDMVAYRGSEWSSFCRFFDARTKLYDFYGLPAYEENREFYDAIGLSRESYTLLENYNFALDESIDTWRLESIAAYQEQLAGEGKGLQDTFGFVSKKSPREALSAYRDQILSDLVTAWELLRLPKPAGAYYAGAQKALCGIAVAAVYLWYLLRCAVPARGKERLSCVGKVLCIAAVRSVMWLYLCMVDRVLDRVAVPLLMAEFATVAGLLLCDKPTEDAAGRFRAVKAAICLLAVAGTAAGAAANLHNVHAEYGLRAVSDERWNALMDYCRKNGNNYYVIDVYSSTSYQGIPYSEKLFANVDNTCRNFDLCGGWAAKSPLARQKLGQFRIRDIQSALCSSKPGRARAYFVVRAGGELEWLVRYYEKRGTKIELRCVDRIWAGTAEPAFDVYELARK